MTEVRRREARRCEGCVKEVGSPKILKFPKSQSSVGCIARFQFLTHMVIINDQKSALEMAWEPS